MPAAGKSPTGRWRDLLLALFDLDDTLLRGDSNYLWARFLDAQGLLDWAEYSPELRRFGAQYNAGQIDFVDYLRFTLQPLRGLSSARIAEIQADFAAGLPNERFYEKGLQRLQMHRDRGDTLILISATNRLYTQPIAERLAVDVLLCSGVEIVAGQCTGEPLGEPCFAAGKLLHFQRWRAQADRATEATSFYSDSGNDLPLLRHVDEPYAVNADERLREVALAEGWPLLDFDEVSDF